jgi:ubiquinone/menaquinone biosynthesis C-methylase UbiE
MKDNFSDNSKGYAIFRPQYPQEMFDTIVSFVKHRGKALDIATGNGQAAVQLAKYFDVVYATDISQSQLDNATKTNNIIYKCESAEQTSFQDVQFDLITVAQAVHWFDFTRFYKEVNRILKPGGCFAVLGYGLLSTNPDSDRIIQYFYKHIIGPYWDAERRYIDAHYKTIPFPFAEQHVPSFENRFAWSFEQLTGYLETWSAVKHYKDEKGNNPLDLIREELRTSWEQSGMEVVFPLLLRVGIHQ